MPDARISVLAEDDLRSIVIYSIRTWGVDKTRAYIKELWDCVEKLAAAPKLGRPCGNMRKGYRCMEQGRHVIFYRINEGSIFVSRILHQKMLPARHLIE